MKTDTRLSTKTPDSPEKIQQRPAAPPAVDIYENADELLIVADMPGVREGDVAISFEKGLLTIEGQRNDAAEGAKLAVELRSLDYRRAFTVPQGIDADKIAAEIRRGVLTVHLPKAAALRPRQIPVRAG